MLTRWTVSTRWFTTRAWRACTGAWGCSWPTWPQVGPGRLVSSTAGAREGHQIGHQRLCQGQALRLWPRPHSPARWEERGGDEYSCESGEVMAGAAAGLSNVLFSNPLELLKIRLQCAGTASLGLASAFFFVHN